METKTAEKILVKGTMSRLHSETGKVSKSGKKYQTGACCYCKKRRKKCDGQYPTCSTCQFASEVCTMIDLASGREIPRNYVETLENKIYDLESTIIEKKRQEIKIIGSAKPSNVETDKFGKIENQSEDEEVDEAAEPENKDFARDVGYITLAAAAEPW